MISIIESFNKKRKPMRLMEWVGGESFERIEPIPVVRRMDFIFVVMERSDIPDF
ncbi:hypothetical protein [Burkholderia stabilis]|uniref:hypothetical protein n=1 Tax=Burkholderia stabilis TaxID=95485 RepID=UPI0013E97BB1|nr:hypothetical protein [Burkholderia stabilis]